MGVLDSFVFLLSADEENAVKGIDRTGQAFEDLKEKGKADSKAVAESFEDAATKIGKVANDIDTALSGVEGAAELSRSADKATLEFINLGSQADATGNKISKSIAEAITEVTQESKKLGTSVDNVGKTDSIDRLANEIRDLVDSLRIAGDEGKKTGKKIKDGVEDVKPKVNDLAAFIHEKLGNISNSLGIGDFAKGFLVTAGAGMSLNAVLDHTATLMGRIRDAETVGVEIGEYDALLRTFTTLGVEADEFRDSMIDLNEAMGEAAADAESGKAKAFKTFGVELKTQTGQIKATDEALLELADSMSRMSKQQATFQIKQLGITDNKVIAAMLSGRKELERMLRVQKEYGTLSQEDAEQVKRFSGAVSELKTMSSHFADELMVALAPAMTMTVEGIALLSKFFSELFNFLSDHQGLVAGVLLPVALVVLPTLTASLWAAASAVWAFLAPLLPFIAIAVALGLVVDDLWNYFTGGESVIGDLAKKFTWLNDFLQTTKELVLELIEAFKEFANNPMKTFESWGNSLKEGFEDAKSWLGIGDDDDPRSQGQALASGANSVLAGASSAPTIPSSTAISNTRGNNTVQQTNDIKITVPSGDPNVISQGVQDGLNGHLDSTMAEFDDGRSH